MLPTSLGRCLRPTRVVTLVVSSVLLLALAVVVAPPSRAEVGVPTTYLDHPYASTVKRPSEDKPQSKLWYHDGSWWALMVSSGGTLVDIHELMPDHTWRDTGTRVDNRVDGTGDALWSGVEGKLYVATRSAGANLAVARFSYQTGSRMWTVDAGFPVIVNTGGGSESATIDRDSTGRLWLTYTRASRLWVARSEPGGQTWTPGFQPNVPDTVIKSDDISTLIAFGTSVGVLWSDQQSGAMRFAIHKDTDPTTVWTVEDALAGATLADDHVNIKQLSGDAQGRLFAAVKTSNDLEGPDATLVGVLVRTPGANGVGTWELVPAGTVADDHTRPIVMIDETNRELYFFATAPGSGGDVFYKKTSLDNPQFGPGRGAPFVNAVPQVTDASGSKDPVSAQTGMVIIANAEGQKRYAHAEMELAGGGPAPDTTPPSVPANVVATPGTGQVQLSWSPSTDDRGVTGYTVLRDGAPVGSPTTASYTDTGLTAGQTYTYTVTARDAANNTSGPSVPVQATVPGSTGGQISLRAAATAANNTEAVLNVPTPDRRAGDLLLATVDYRGGATLTPPPGWTLVRQDQSGTALRKVTFSRVATDAEPATQAWRFSTRVGAVGSMSAYSGVSATDPVQASAGQVSPANSRTITAPSVPTGPGAVMVGLFGVGRAAGISSPSAMTERSEIRSPATVTYACTAATADLTATGASSGAQSATSTVNGPTIGHTVALSPAG